MGLIKAALGAASGVMGDQWKEYFYCDALPAEVLSRARSGPMAALPTGTAAKTSSRMAL